jgi:hypothetical protein
MCWIGVDPRMNLPHYEARRSESGIDDGDGARLVREAHTAHPSRQVLRKYWSAAGTFGKRMLTGSQ